MNVLNKNINNIFFIFAITHLIIWTMIPSLTNSNLPLDTIEALAWGSNLDWGFNKHPPMSAFFSEVFYNIFGNKNIISPIIKKTNLSNQNFELFCLLKQLVVRKYY